MNGILETIITSLQEIVGSLVRALPGLIAGVIILFLARYAAKTAHKLARKVGKKTLPSASLRLLLEKTSYILTFTVGVLLAGVVAFPGLSLGDIIAALGLGSVAIGFAFQDIFKNFLAGILLLLQEPFRIGDQIIVAGYEGTVEHIDIRTTRIRTYQGEEIIVPNATVFTNEIQVRTAYDYRRTDLGVGVDYNTPLPMAQDLLKTLIQDVEGVLNYPPPEIDLVGFGDSSIDFVIRYWTQPQQQIVRRVQTKAIIAIKREFDEAEITIPYPIRTVYYYDQQRFNDYLPINGQESNNN
ncbi:MAG: mechanosensitive ion channel family protein [Halothece sp. Uz-M2-17]|nr:mechanosensitive ion channel family protein [Halothece sp. Uz-M2-17]